MTLATAASSHNRQNPPTKQPASFRLLNQRSLGSLDYLQSNASLIQADLAQTPSDPNPEASSPSNPCKTTAATTTYIALASFSEIFTDRFGFRLILGSDDALCDTMGIRLSFDYARQTKISLGTLSFGLNASYYFAPLESFKLYGGAGFGYQNRGLASAHAAVNQGVYISSLAGFDYGLSEQVGLFAEFNLDYYLSTSSTNIPDPLNQSYRPLYPTLALGLKYKF
ncbi:MAG: hypothetical protein R2880_12140 [Deinococcales bacterium]